MLWTSRPDPRQALGYLPVPTRSGDCDSPVTLTSQGRTSTKGAQGVTKTKRNRKISEREEPVPPKPAKNHSATIHLATRILFVSTDSRIGIGKACKTCTTELRPAAKAYQRHREQGEKPRHRQSQGGHAASLNMVGDLLSYCPSLEKTGTKR